MSSKLIRGENKPDLSQNVTSKCIAIVLIAKSRRNSSNLTFDNNETIVDTTDGGSVIQSAEAHGASSGYNGKELLRDFKMRNKTCYWNPSLVESITSLEYKGFVEPSTILVTGADIHLENLRSAWGRRILKAPAGFIIERIGDVNGIQMQVIPQTQCMPLPDALCSIIMHLNLHGIVATLDMILDKLVLWFKNMAVPSHQMIVDMLGTLIKERKVFHTGSGYFVVTPETNRLQNSANSSYMPTNASWLPYHPMYVPVFQRQHPMQSRAHMRSISCQVTTIEESSEEEDNINKKKDMDKDQKTTTGRQSEHLGQSREDEDKCCKSGQGVIKTVTEVTFKQPTTTTFKFRSQHVKTTKDVNLKSGNNNQGKAGKTSLFSKLFSRKRKEKDKDKGFIPPPLPCLVPSSATTSSSDAMSEGNGEKEYATFSAQFPPPEWVWYQQQIDKHKRTETWLSQQITYPSQLSKTARPSKSTKMHTFNPILPRVSRKSGNQESQLRVDYIPMNAVASVEDKFINTQVLHQDCEGFVKPFPVTSENIYESFSNESSIKHSHHYQKCPGVDRKKYQKCPDYSVIDVGDVTPLNSSVYQSVLTLSPVGHLLDGSTYYKTIQQPQLGPIHSTPLSGDQLDRTAYRVDGHEARDRIYGPPGAFQKRESRRHAHRVYSYYGGQGSDISFEYTGCLPKKNASHAQSRDSGVNCVGLGMPTDQNKKSSDHFYENISKKHNEQHDMKYKQKKQSKNNHLISSQVCSPDKNTRDDHHRLQASSSTNSATQYSVLAYESHVTNTAYNSVLYGSNPAYNSVVYGSMTDINGCPSVMYHSTADLHCESSEMFPHCSLQSVFYEENNLRQPTIPSACSQIKCQTAESVVEPLSSAETVIVDVAGSPSQVEEVLSYSCEVMLRLGTEIETPEPGLSLDVKIVERRYSCPGVDADVCVDNDEEPVGNSACIKRTIDKSEVTNDTTTCCGTSHSESAYRQGGQDTDNKKCSVIDSGCSSPIDAESTSGRATCSNQSTSSRENSCGVDEHANNSDSQHNCQSTVDINNSQQTSESSGHHSNSDLCMVTGSELHSGSNINNMDLCNRECHEITLESHLSKVNQGNSLTSHNQLHQASPNHKNSVQHNLPAAKHLHHHDPVSITHKDHSHTIRVPLHPNSGHYLHKSHRAGKPQERPYSGQLWKSNITNDDLTDLEHKKQQSRKYKLNEEFEIMGVL